ncbi:hypothetical protein [Daejeonia sp. YH14]|uniref:hypothetical protein n=1 Tax=Daejeonia sp. YH14 TaxID=3439042 RepID=UPI003F497F58
MEKQLIFRDARKIADETQTITAIAEKLQENLNPLFEIAETEINIADLDQLFSNPKAFFTNILVPDNPTINGMAISKAKMFDLLEIPESIKATILKTENFVKDWEHIGKYLWCIEVSNNEIKIKQSILQDIENRNTVYIETEKGETVYNAVIAMSTAMQTIKNSMGYSQFNIELFKKFFAVNDDFVGSPKGYGKDTFDINFSIFKGL